MSELSIAESIRQDYEEEIHKKEAMYDSLAVDYRLAQEEIERLNNIIKYLEEYFSEREYYEFAQLVRETRKANIEWLEGAVKDYE